MERDLKGLVEEMLNESECETYFGEDTYGNEIPKGCVFYVDVRYIEALTKLVGIDLKEHLES